MKKNIFLFVGISLLTISLLSFSIHKYYISLTEIEYNSENKSIEMIMNLFVDDIESALNKDYNLDLQLNTKKELKDTNQYLTKYLNEHFKILVNQKAYQYNFLGKEYDGDIVNCYLEIENINDVKSIEIENNVLTQHFTEQQNLIKLKIKGERKTLFLTKKNDKGLLNF